MDLIAIGAKLGVYFVPFLFALCLHEVAHGWVAKLRGDRTAELSGRLSMNPMVHADMLGTFVLPISAILLGGGFFFGWAKPVPVDARNFKRPKQDMFWVALAGPASNVLQALAGTALLALFHDSAGNAINQILQVFIRINLFLAFFNLLPVHPLDGGKVIEPFLPYEWNRWLELNAPMLNLGLLFFILFAGGLFALPVSLLADALIQRALS